MGATTRRQPISFGIPAAPDYKFLNITNFGGLDVSSNPFVVSSNTASDCLNVYVDEDNALSTRPRLQKKYDLMALAGLDDSYTLVNVYNIHNGYLLHTVKNNKGFMYRFEEDNGVLKSPKQITGHAIPTGSCDLFEQNGNIYLLTGGGYKTIIKDEISDVVGYVPTTSVGKYAKKSVKNSDGSVSIEINPAGEQYESLNLLSNKFKETYFWDGTWSLDSLKQYPSDTLVNDYIKQDEHYLMDENGNDFDYISVIQPVRALSNNPDGKKYFLCYLPDYVDRFGSEYVLMAVDGTNRLLVNETFGIPFTLNQYDTNGSFTYEISNKTIVCSDNGLTVACVSWNTVWNKPNLLYVCTRTSTKDEFTQTLKGYGPFDEQAVEFYPSTDTNAYLKLSSDGRVVSWRSKENEVSVTYWHDFTKSPEQPTTILNCLDYDINILDSSRYSFVYSELDADKIVAIRSGLLTKTQSSDDVVILKHTPGNVIKPWTEFEEPSDIVFKILPNTRDFYTSIKLSENDTLSRSALLKISSRNNDVVVVTESTTTSKWSKLNLIYDNALEYLYFQNTDGKFTGRLSIDTNDGVSSNLPISIDITTANIDKYEIIGVNTLKYTSVQWYDRIKLLLDSKEPLVTLIRNVEELENDDSEKYLKIKNEFNSAKLSERFDNNTWFASKNYTFHTLYNDPTYIPLSSYNDLGEDFEYITGLSIVNDNVLAAYKRNRIYIITPVTVGSQETYSYTETKNVVGNDVPNAPILTILTEMPTIVSYDGIYALNQLENVQSSDRITTLISESINPRWLKESSEDIDNCKTLNRLYWTYYILPHKKIGSEKKDFTKVYLLDNRTQQWYYWELPVYVVNAMIKDNKTHLVHADGKIFTLETSDLIHEYNIDVTEYYDKVGKEKLIIPWHWTSQILSLNTINYSKKLVDTTFILTDTDTQDEYGLDYSFKAWRKSVSETNATTISNNIHYVQSTTKRTMIPRFNFIQIKLSNTVEDLDNNKLRLVGLGLKYVLLEGLY